MGAVYEDEPVSYTHLDVYKRQVYAPLCMLILINGSQSNYSLWGQTECYFVSVMHRILSTLQLSHVHDHASSIQSANVTLGPELSLLPTWKIRSIIPAKLNPYSHVKGKLLEIRLNDLVLLTIYMYLNVVYILKTPH